MQGRTGRRRAKRKATARTSRYWCGEATPAGKTPRYLTEGYVCKWTIDKKHRKHKAYRIVSLQNSDVKKQFFQKRIKGRGYCDVGTSVISEFYTPLVPKGHDFLQTIGFLSQARQDGTATCEAKGDGTD